MMGLQDAIGNGRVVNRREREIKGNLPQQYQGINYQYYANETKEFTKSYARYASNYLDAMIQGLIPGDPYSWKKEKIRMANVFQETGKITKTTEDYKWILFENPRIDYIQPGVKMKALGSTWLCVNPNNMGAAQGTALFLRCNSVWRHLDYYGNEKEEPMAIETPNMLANANDDQHLVLITRGYFDVICQYNEDTAQLGQNSRMILGSTAYQITGYSDFIQEFTGEDDSVRSCRFTLRWQEPNETDDMERRIAGSKVFSWGITVKGNPRMETGGSQDLEAFSVRNGEPVFSSTQFPISYSWATSNEAIAKVDENGTVQAIGIGTVEITATLEQNLNISQSFEIEIGEGSQGTRSLLWKQEPARKLMAGEEETLCCAVYEDGKEIDAGIRWSFTGAEKEAWSAEIDGNCVTIKCWGGSVKSLKVTATADTGEEISVEIPLLGV